MAGRDKRARATGRLGTTRGERYALLPEEVMESAAYLAQPDWARSVLFALACRFHGHNNGDLSLPFREAKRLGIAAQWKLYASLRLLERADLIVCTRRGMLRCGRKLPSLYAVTWRGIDRIEGLTYDGGIVACPLPGNAWARWTRPPDWKSIVKIITRSNRGSSRLSKKNPHTQMLGNGRSQRVGATDTPTATQRWGKEHALPAPDSVETSKTSEGVPA